MTVAAPHRPRWSDPAGPAYRDEVRLKFLLQPGWLSMIVAGLIFAAISFSVLAPWQFRRDTERVQQNNAIQSSFTAKPVPLDQVLTPQQAPDARTEWRTVTLTGQYLPQNEMVARLRSVLTEPAYEVLTPLRLTTGGIALVDRGFIRPVDSTALPPFTAAPSGTVTVTARIRQDEIDPKHRDAITISGTRQVYTIDSHTVSRAAGLTIRPGYYELTDAQPGGLSTLPLPELDAGPFFAYAVQWLIFGAFAIFGLGYLIWRELNPESDDLDLADFDEQAEFDDLELDGDAHDQSPPMPPQPAAGHDSSPAGSITEGQLATGSPDSAQPGSAQPGSAQPSSSTPASPAPPRPVPADRYGRRR